MEWAAWAEILTEARKRAMLTQQELAERVGVDFTTISRWETGKATPRGRNLRRLSEELGLQAEELGLEGNESVDRPLASPEEMQAFTQGDLTMRLLALAFMSHRSFYATQSQLIQILEEDAMHDPVTRRYALRRLAMLPFATLDFNASAMHRGGLSVHVLNQYAASIAACWQLSKSSDETDLDLAFTSTSDYIVQLEALVKDASWSQSRQAAASLVGQCFSLKTVLGWHREGLDRAMGYAHQAVLYSEQAKDLPLQISAHVQLAWVYYYARQYNLSLQTIELAAHLLKSSKVPLPPDLHGHVQSTLAIPQAIFGQRQQALTAVRLAHERFFAQPETDDKFIYVDYSLPSLILEEGMAYAHLSSHDKALDSFAQIVDPNDLSSKIPVAKRIRLEALNNQISSLLKKPKKEKESSLERGRAKAADMLPPRPHDLT